MVRSTLVTVYGVELADARLWSEDTDDTAETEISRRNTGQQNSCGVQVCVCVCVCV